MWSRQILELRKQFNLITSFQNILKASLQDVFADVLKTPWRYLEDAFARRLEDVFKTSWRRLEEVLKTSWRRLEDVWPRLIYWSRSRRLEEVFWRRMTKVNIFVLIKTSSSRRVFTGIGFSGLSACKCCCFEKLLAAKWSTGVTWGTLTWDCFRCCEEFLIVSSWLF